MSPRPRARSGACARGLLALWALFALSGCPHGAFSTGGGAPIPAERAYLEVYEDWTRELRLTRTWETHLLLEATLLSEPMLRAQSAYASAAWLDTPADATRRLDAALAGRDDALVIVFSAYSPWDDAREFALDLDAPWRVRAQADGAPLAPLSLTRVARPTAAQRMLYPEHDAWSELWVAAFAPPPPGADEITFQIAGPRGRGEIRWAME